MCNAKVIGLSFWLSTRAGMLPFVFVLPLASPRDGSTYVDSKW